LLNSRGDDLAPESKKGILAYMMQEAEKLNQMISDLFALARLELGQQVATEPVLVHRFVERVADAFERSRPYRNVQVEIDPAVPPIEAEPTYLEQILRNLLSNADKYSPSESPIGVRVQNAQSEVVTSVVDEGPGVAPEELELIFERFYRASGAGKNGTGIGLTVCKRLVEAQSGRIWAQRRATGGLEVSFTLPVYVES
jgi:two-component system sensor histidine kinase KdpD